MAQAMPRRVRRLMAAPDAPALRGDDRDKISKAFERDAYGTRYSLTQYELSNIYAYCYRIVIARSSCMHQHSKLLRWGSS